MYSFLIPFFSYQFAQFAFIATVLITLTCGFLSPLVVLKQRSYLGDTLSHLVFPGVVVGVLFAYSLNIPLWICVFCGAVVTALIGTFLSEYVLKKLKIPPDSSAILCLTAFFAVGIIAISTHKGIRISPDSILFGDVLTLNSIDIYILSGVFFLVLLSILFYKRHWDAWLIDPEFAEIAGFKIKTLNFIFPILLTLCVLSGIFAVGGLMISALITIPAILYQPRSVFSPMVVLISLCAGIAGIFIAFSFDWPVGPTIVLVGFCAVIIKTFFVSLKRNSHV